MKTALTIAGSDSCGGAGIQADIKTMMANGVYAMSAITALTAQNTTGVTSILNADSKFLGEELDAVFTDIYPDAVKIGMVSESDLIHVIASKLRQYNAKNIVVDPVMVATSGAKLISDDAIDTLKQELFSLADVLTPNIPEAEVLTGRTISNADEMIDAAKMISETYNCAVLCKGGHTINDANDLLYVNNTYRWFYGKRIQNLDAHCPPQSHQILQRDLISRHLYAAQRTISLAHYLQCLTLEKEAVLWITALQSIIFTQRRLTSNYGKENFSI